MTQTILFASPQKHDPGGKVSIPVPPSWKCDAVFSPCEKYRYELSRIWNDKPGPSLVLFVLMNPSTADASFNDPTIAKCCRFAQKWGHDGVLIGNVCAYRATDKRNMPDEPIEALGPNNHVHILAMAQRASLIVVAYGQLPEKLKVFGVALSLYLHMYGFRLHVLKQAKDGAPVHPLYLPETLAPIIWEPAP